MKERPPISKVIVEHSPDCRTQGTPGEWSSSIIGEYFGNKFGTANTKIGCHHRWLKVRCNDPRCGGVKAVRASILATA